MTAKPYVVASGVPFVNGLAVPENRVVHLTEPEAAFDLALARISLQATTDEDPAVTGKTEPLRRSAAATDLS